jgi:DNA primase
MYDIRQPKGKTSVLKEVKGYLDATESEIERQEYIVYLSNALRVPAEHVMSDYRRQRTEAPAQTYREKPVEVQELNPLKASTELTAMLILMKNRDRFEKFRSEIKLNHLKDDAARTLYIVLEDAVRQDIVSDDLILRMIEDPQLRNLVVTAFTSDMYRRTDADKALTDAVYQIKLAQLEESRASVQRMLNGGMDITDEQELDNLLQAKLELDRKIQELKGEMEG